MGEPEVCMKTALRIFRPDCREQRQRCLIYSIYSLSLVRITSAISWGMGSFGLPQLPYRHSIRRSIIPCMAQAHLHFGDSLGC